MEEKNKCGYQGQDPNYGSCNRKTRCCKGCYRINQCELPCKLATEKQCNLKNT